MLVLKRILNMKLWKQVIVALLLGTITGIILQEKAESLQYLGTIFINLIKMVIVPLILFSLVSAITQMESSGKASMVAIKSVAAFLCTSIAAVLIGIITTTILSPGIGVKVPIPAHNFKSEEIYLAKIFIGFIPENAIGAMAQGNIIQVIVFSVIVGLSMASIKDKCSKTIEICNEISAIVFKIIEFIVRLAPLGVFGYIAWSVGTQGIDVIITLSYLVGIIILCCILQYIFYGLYIWLFAGLNPMNFYKKMLEPQLLAFSTSSSKASLSTTMRVMNEEMGVSKSSTNFVLQIGTSINMNGGAIYLSATCIFFAQSMNINLSLYQYIILGIMCTIGSIGAAGIPSGILLFLGMALESISLPAEFVVLVAGVDRILDMFTTMINVMGDACITTIIDKRENMMQIDKYNS